MPLTLFINLTIDGKWAIIWPPIIATGYVSFAAILNTR